MRKHIAVLIIVFLITSCNNNDKPQPDKEQLKKEKTSEEDGPGENIKNRKKVAGTYTWPAKEQDEFIADCKKESSGEVVAGDLNEFCSCVLEQAQKFYPGYREMDRGSNEEDDEKIFENCLVKYPPVDK